jgi:acetate kinase
MVTVFESAPEPPACARGQWRHVDDESDRRSGLPMGTRSGAIDPGVILYLLSERGMSIDEVTDLLYHRSGLLGVSGMSNDMRNLLASPAREAADNLGGKPRIGTADSPVSVWIIPTNEEMMIASHTLACIPP